jgi:hypothetical protein
MSSLKGKLVGEGGRETREYSDPSLPEVYSFYPSWDIPTRKEASRA